MEQNEQNKSMHRAMHAALLCACFYFAHVMSVCHVSYFTNGLHVPTSKFNNNNIVQKYQLDLEIDRTLECLMDQDIVVKFTGIW